jgi:hypothetical protein
VKEYGENSKISIVKEEDSPYMKTFSSQEDAERYNMIENIRLNDMEKFKLFCRMMRIGKMLSSAKIVK